MPTSGRPDRRWGRAIDRRGDARGHTDADATGWETVWQDYVDEGWKDAVLLMPGERVKLVLRFSDYAGLYLYHCHNLEHEDQGMMRNCLVQA
jgi:FtsP/CotA-like multicopper oxidase with cupredoxin domain